MNINEVMEIISAIFPAVVLFLIIPSSLYFSNQDSFYKDYSIVFTYVSIFVSAIVAIGGMVYYFHLSALANIFFYFGAFLLLKDSFVPVQLKDFKNLIQHDNINYSHNSMAKELLLAAVAVFAAVIWPIALWSKFSGGFVILLLLIETLTLVKNQRLWIGTWKNRKQVKKCSPPSEKSGKGNVYHIVLDSFYGPFLQDYLKGSKSRNDFLDGFSYFYNTLSNYDHTYPSIASFMTGKLYQEGESLSKFKDSWLSGGLIEKLYEKGFSISQYVFGDNWTHEKATSKVFPEDGKPSGIKDILSNFADVWLLRVVPSAIKKRIYSLKRGGYLGPFSAICVSDIVRKNRANCLPINAVKLFKKLMEDEEKRPADSQYVHTHLYFPHMPYIYEADGTIKDKTGYQAQTSYAITLLEEFLRTLKEQGKYKDATIIIHSDHGIWEDIQVNGLLHSNPEVLSNKFVNALRALLLVKKPGDADTPMEVVEATTQLGDIPRTIAELNDIEFTTEIGQDLFELDLNECRKLHIHLGYHTSKGEFGQAVQKGTLRNRIFDTHQGWKKLPDLNAVWEKK